ncbi:hypothetical protein RhiXN_11762 [Rhizoctonia solani]|uniref:Uncharacterized protein n=1 Tax=Rhizoctonia solani TaxID=456999 RepID=A0A8H8P432_9AGAM|nr:uncharacterized protein RhiXN_11762 [Rhizoctonia solani]QRW24850.1 hypothetical protein RhiXN_11762 [Rhizoctonia solani]
MRSSFRTNNMSFMPGLSPQQQGVLADNLTFESRVNGFWFSVLGQYFPTPAYLINAEEHVTTADRPDLYVTRLDWGLNNQSVKFSPVAVFEGKGNTPGADNFEKIKAQLARYGKSTTDAERVGGVYCVGAKGRKISFWYFKKGDMIELKPILSSRSGLIIKDTAQMPPELDVINEAVTINDCFRFILANPVPTITR